jgi:hypothetical protein
MSLFGTQKASKGTVDEVAGMISHYFSERGMNAKDQKLSSAEGYGWWLRQGSAKIYIFIQETQTGPVIRVTSPVVHVPQAKRDMFYCRLLNINSNLTCCALALHNDVVLVVSQRHTSALDQEELDDLIWNVAFVADLMDDQLHDEFGATPYSETHN